MDRGSSGQLQGRIGIIGHIESLIPGAQWAADRALTTKADGLLLQVLEWNGDAGTPADWQDVLARIGLRDRS